MQHAATLQRPPDVEQDMVSILPLFAASLVVTLAGVGAVGVTVTLPSWTPVWVCLAIIGHLVSYGLRWLRVPAETIFYPVMVLGTAITLKLALEGSPLVGMDVGLAALSSDMATATTVGAIAVLRTFTLVTNGSLLFSPVPAITMLALVGSSNPNAEVPLFFGLLVLGSLFLSGYEAHLRRVERVAKPASPVLMHLLASWCVTLGVSAGALLFPVLLQPVMGPLSPFALPAVGKLQGLINFTQTAGNQAPVGQGPINLSPVPLYEIYTPEGGKFRTDVFTNYTGKSWTADRQPSVTDIHSDEKSKAPPIEGDEDGIQQTLYLFTLDPRRHLGPGIPTHTVRQRIVTKGFGSDGVPALGLISELRYPRSDCFLHADGTVSGTGHLATNRQMEVISEVPDFPVERLRRAPKVDPDTFNLPETLELPASTLEVQQLAREITRGRASSYDQIEAILEHIEKTCRYTLQEEPTPTGEDAAAYYLFKTKRGACDLAATALAVMCRSVGIPARVAVGYVADEPLPNGNGFLVRQEHAHMWVEAFFPGSGWVPFDPAPPLAQIRDNMFDIAWSRFRAMLSRIGGGGLDAVLLLIVILATLALAAYRLALFGIARLRARLRERARQDGSPGRAIAAMYSRALRGLERAGWKRDPSMTPGEYLESLRREWSAWPEALATLEALTGLFVRSHYAGVAAEEDVRKAEELRRALARLAPRREVPAPAAAEAGSAA